MEPKIEKSEDDLSVTKISLIWIVAITVSVSVLVLILKMI